MLVLSRKLTQSIVIDERVTIQVVRIRGGSVSLGIEAPPDVVIRRSELACAPHLAAPSRAELLPVSSRRN